MRSLTLLVTNDTGFRRSRCVRTGVPGRQHPVGHFILDFCCPEVGLAVELDGAIHDTQEGYDDARSDQLEAWGYRVLRFRNEVVLSQVRDVLRRIEEATAGQGDGTDGPAPAGPWLG